MSSLVLLTISSILIVFQTETAHSTESSEKNQVIGFICSVAASAEYGLLISLKQLALVKVFKRENFKVIIDMNFYESLVATFINILVRLFASGEWDALQKDMMSLGWESHLYGDSCLGHISYLYQHYLDDTNFYTEYRDTYHVSRASKSKELDIWIGG
ncbi:hypothetical protein RJT34_04566 [Clitoria ternatea]|uniref:Cyclotide n=1 Tax=Clitoria ternatea TaxID=43366 RepID=A0AAN9KPF9_CLITE